ncbi:LuxR family transcriptional regulator [soil metagenome]
MVAVGEFLAGAAVQPSALVVEGEPGIGKTTVLQAVVERARHLGFQVLEAHPAEAESVLAYAAVGDLLAGIDDLFWAQLPRVQRLALDRVMSRDDTGGPAIDQRAVAAGFLTLVQILAQRGQLLLMVDDVQWLDPSSAQVVAFAARRLNGRMGILLAVRSEPNAGARPDWLQLPRPDGIHRLRIQPLSLGGLHAVVSERLGRSFPRPVMTRIAEVSGGNPFYAIELARAIDGAAGAEMSMPTTLTDLVRGRIGQVDAEVQACLLATACLATPTIEVVAHAVKRKAGTVVDLLQQAEDTGLIEIDGHRLRFTHPLLARGVYTDARPSQRRMMHQRLAEVVQQPELRARHLALAATGADRETVDALDEAAESAQNRGAPAAAAEFVTMAIKLGDDTPRRRIQLAALHFYAGDNWRSRSVLQQVIEESGPGTARAEALSLLGRVLLFADSFVAAAEALESALAEAGDNLQLRVPILIALSFALVNVGRMDAGLARGQEAVTDATQLGRESLLSEALGTFAVLRFMRGDGLDDEALQRALALEDQTANTPVAFRPSAHHALMLTWTGRLAQARPVMAGVRRRCAERGEESELVFIDFHSMIIEIWSGEFAAATLIAEDFMERARQLGSDLALLIALTMKALLAAYTGRLDDARRDAREALAAGQRSGSARLSEWPITVLGFVEVSVGNHQAALAALEPLLAFLGPEPDGTEIIAAWFVADAVEAMIGLGRGEEAEPLVGALERNGRRLDRAWMLATGGRCRAMLQAADGDVSAATETAQRAMAEHDRLPMPFERARTQLLLGQLHRRQRQRLAAAACLNEALATFDRLGAPIWAQRARDELTRANTGSRTAGGLTAAEQRVAELAASGLTNREVAAALFISPKTVEANLARIYRKLGIRSRAELGRLVSIPPA